MGLFSRRQREPEWQPPARPHCSCARHLDEELLASVVPYVADMADDDLEPVTVADLLHPGGLSVDATRPDERRLADSAATFHWTVSVYDDARVHYDDDTALDLDAGLARQQGVDEVAWVDREVFMLSAPTLCSEGVLAAAAVVLLDDRVRLAAD